MFLYRIYQVVNVSVFKDQKEGHKAACRRLSESRFSRPRWRLLGEIKAGIGSKIIHNIDCRGGDIKKENLYNRKETF